MAFIKLAFPKFHLALASGARRKIIDIALEKFNLADCFEVIISNSDYSKGKPDPEIFQKTIEKLNLRPNEYVVIEDAPSGIEAAKKAGAFTIAVTNTSDKEKLIEADLVVKTLRNLNIEELF